MQSSILFLYTRNGQVELEIKHTIPFTLAPTKMKYVGRNFTEYVQDLNENHQTPKKKIKELNKWRVLHGDG